MYNRVNANIAVTGIKDNITMKTLAIVAGIFLPGTYIAVCYRFMVKLSLTVSRRFSA